MTTDKSFDKNQALAKDGNAGQKLQLQLAEKMMGSFDSVISSRSTYYDENPDKIPAPSDIPAIINSCATKNALKSGGVALLPGPLGMAVALPEIALLIRSQLAMVYDIGVAHGKGKVLNKELLAGIFLSALGSGATGLLVMQGGKVLVQRATLRVFQQLVTLLAGNVTQKMLKSLIAPWIPGVGAIAMGAWSNYSTRQLGKKAAEILAKSIEVSEEESDDEGIVEGAIMAQPATVVAAAPIYTNLKIKALINLMKVDKKLAPEERGYIEVLIENSELADETKIELANLVDAETKTPVDFALFAKDPDEMTGMLIVLVALAQRDGEFRLAEKIYIKQAAKLMGVSESDVEEAMAVEQTAA